MKEKLSPLGSNPVAIGELPTITHMSIGNAHKPCVLEPLDRTPRAHGAYAERLSKLF